MTNSQYRTLRKELARLYTLNNSDRVYFFALKPFVREKYGYLQNEFDDVWIEFCNEKFRATNPDQLSLEIGEGDHE